MYQQRNKLASFRHDTRLPAFLNAALPLA